MLEDETLKKESFRVAEESCKLAIERRRETITNLANLEPEAVLNLLSSYGAPLEDVDKLRKQWGRNKGASREAHIQVAAHVPPPPFPPSTPKNISPCFHAVSPDKSLPFLLLQAILYHVFRGDSSEDAKKVLKRLDAPEGRDSAEHIKSLMECAALTAEFAELATAQHKPATSDGFERVPTPSPPPP